MSFTIKHAMVSGKADGLDTSFVQPSNWNADHSLLFSTDDVFIGRALGSGPGAGQELALTQYTVPLGAVVALAHSTLPTTGYLWCNGQTVNRVTYAALFAQLSITYGAGDGVTTFAVPDLRGRVIAGLDNMGGVASAARLNAMASTTLGATGGGQSNASAVSVSGTVFVGGSTSGSLSVTGQQNGDYSLLRGCNGTDGPLVAQNGATSSITGSTSGSLTVSANGGNSMSGSTASFTVVQSTMVMNLVIRY